MLVVVLLFVLGLILLIKGGDWFVDGATGIAHKFSVPEVLIGATVVSIGTTLPEVMVSATSAMQGFGSMAYGNAIGSIICNTALISALTIAIKPSFVDRKSLVKPLIFFFGAAGFYSLVAYMSGFFSRIVGLILLGIFVIYMLMQIVEARKGMNNANSEDAEGDGKANSTGKDILLLIVGAVLIAIGARLLVDNGTKIAEAVGVPQTVIALTFVALGTSLPELVTAITALAKGHGALSLGNIIGANLFNLVLVCGVSISVNPFAVPSEKTINVLGAVRNASLVVDIPVMLLVMILMTIPSLITGKLRRWQGVTLLAIYASYIIFQFVG